MEVLTISAESLVARNETDFLFTEVDEETVLMNIHTSSYIGLNPVSTDIWKLLEEKKTFKNLVENLMELYEVELETCEKETRQSLVGMVRNNILQLD